VSGVGIFHPSFRVRPFWWEDAEPSAADSDTLPARADVLVIGSGYAGLAAAIELARNGVAVVVTEAARFGEGGSTRNGGQVTGGIGFADPAHADDPAMLARVRDGIASFQFLEHLIRRERIDCAYQPVGKYFAAWTPAHYERLKAKAALLNASTALRAWCVPAEEQREEIGSGYYYGGLAVEPAALVNPALLHRGLLDACRRAGVTLCAETPVTMISGARGAYCAATPRGSLTAKEIIVATNGYTGAVMPALRRRVVPLASYIIATEPLEPATAQALIPRGRAVSDTCRVLTYFRLSPDGRRMVFGGRARFLPTPPETAAADLYTLMVRRFPQLDGVRISHAWSGMVAFAFDRLPHMGEMDGVHFALCCNGNGVAMMTYLGHQTARKILQRAGQATCAFDTPSFPTRPLYRGDPAWILPFIATAYRARDVLERIGAAITRR
jgi:glycine/D-amino acid oxidase-like deaminating enzyme